MHKKGYIVCALTPRLAPISGRKKRSAPSVAAIRAIGPIGRRSHPTFLLASARLRVIYLLPLLFNFAVSIMSFSGGSKQRNTSTKMGQAVFQDKYLARFMHRIAARLFATRWPGHVPCSFDLNKIFIEAMQTKSERPRLRAQLDVTVLLCLRLASGVLMVTGEVITMAACRRTFYEGRQAHPRIAQPTVSAPGLVPVPSVRQPDPLFPSVELSPASCVGADRVASHPSHHKSFHRHPSSWPFHRTCHLPPRRRSEPGRSQRPPETVPEARFLPNASRVQIETV